MIDVSEVYALARDMAVNGARIAAAVVVEAERAGKSVQQGMRAEIRGRNGFGHLTSFPASITYDVRARLRGDVEVEVGPDKDRAQGALGNLLYFGSSKNAPIAVLDGPALREVDRVARTLSELGATVTKGGR